MSEIKVNSLSLLDSNERDCLILTYVDMRNDQIRKRLMPIRANLWPASSSTAIISSDSTVRTSKRMAGVLLQSLKAAYGLKRRHPFHLRVVDNRKLVQLLLALKLRKQGDQQQVSVQRPLPALSWTDCEQNAVLVIEESNEDFDDLSAAIERMESQLSKPNKKQVSFNPTPEQFHFEKYEGEDEFNASNQDQYLDDQDDDDFVF